MEQGLFAFQIGGQTKQRVLDDGDLNYIIEVNSIFLFSIENCFIDEVKSKSICQTSNTISIRKC